MNTYLTKHFSMKLQTQRGLFVRFFQSLKLSTLGKLLGMLTLLGVVALGLVACGGGGGSSGGGGGGGCDGDNCMMLTVGPVVTVADAMDLGVVDATGGPMSMSLTRQTESGVNPGEDTYKVEYAVDTAVSMDLSRLNGGTLRLFAEDSTLLYSTDSDEYGQAIGDIRPSSALAPRSSGGFSPRNEPQNFNVICPRGSVYYIVVVLPEGVGDGPSSGDDDDAGYTIPIDVEPVTIPVDDHKNSFAESTPLTISSDSATDDGVIGSLEDVDVFKFTLTETKSVTFWTTGEAGTVGALFDSRYEQVAGPANGGNNGFSFAVSALDPGVYYVAVSGSLGATKSTGAYTLNISCQRAGWRFYSRARFQSGGDAIQTKTYKPDVTFDLFSLVGNDSSAKVASPAIAVTYYRVAKAAFEANGKVINPSASATNIVVGTSDVPVLQPGEDIRGFVQAVAPSTNGTYHYATCVPHEGNLGRQCARGDIDHPLRDSDYVTVIVDNINGADGDTAGPKIAGWHLSPGTSLDLGNTQHARTIAANTQFTFYLASCNWIRAIEDSPAATMTAYRSTDTTISEADTNVGTVMAPALAPGVCATHTFTSTTPSTPGDYYYGACAPASIGGVNNADAGRCTPVTYSDGDPGLVTITVPDPSAPSSGWYFWSRARFAASGDAIQTKTYKPGVTFDLFSLVGNGSGVSVASPAIAVTYYRATKAAFDGRAEKVIDPSVDTVVGTSDVPVLQPGEDIRGFVQAITPTANGTYHYATCVPHTGNLGGQCARGDIDHPLRDSDYVTVIVAASGADGDTSGGKVAGWHLSVGTALTEGFTEHARTIAANTQFTFYLASCNWIRAAEDSPAATVTALRSTDATISDDGSDTTVGTAMVRGLFPGVCATHTFTPTTPATAGVYHYGACAPATVGSVNNSEVGRCTPATYSDGDPGYVTVTVPAAGTSQGACTSGTVYTPGQFCTLAYDSKNYTFEVFSVSPFASVAEGGTLNYGANFANPAVGIISELYWNVPYVASVPFLPIRAYESSDTNYKVELGAACVSGHAYTAWEWCTYTYNSKEYIFTVDPPDSYFAGIIGDDDGGNAGACVRDAGWAAAGDSDNVDICNGEGSLSPYGVSVTENANGSFTLTLL